jgi:hypothetical protein
LPCLRQCVHGASIGGLSGPEGEPGDGQACRDDLDEGGVARQRLRAHAQAVERHRAELEGRLQSSLAALRAHPWLPEAERREYELQLRTLARSHARATQALCGELLALESALDRDQRASLGATLAQMPDAGARALRALLGAGATEAEQRAALRVVDTLGLHAQFLPA